MACRKIADFLHKIMEANTSPASGPSLDCMPTAYANGSATILAVIPPNKLPLKFENILLSIIFKFLKLYLYTYNRERQQNCQRSRI